MSEGGQQVERSGGAGRPVDAALRQVARGLGRARPGGFVPALLEHIADAVAVDLTFLARDVSERPGWGTMSGLWWRPSRRQLPPFSYLMAGTPCASGELCVAEEARTLYPSARLLQELAIEAVVAVPLLDRCGVEVGHLGAMHTEPLSDPEATLSLLRLLATLAATELDREEALVRLVESEQRLQGFLDNAPFGAYFYERRPSGRIEITGLNAAADRISAIDGAQHIGRTQLEAFPYVAGTEVPDTLERAVAGEGPFWLPELRLEVDGRPWVLELHVFPTGPGRAAVLFYDLTSRDQVEGALRETEERLHKVLEHAPFGAFTYALDEGDVPVLVGANTAADRILGVETRPLVGLRMVEAFPALAETDLPQQYVEVALGRRGPLYQPRVPYHERGISGVYEIHAFRTGARRMAVLFRDVTAQARADEAERAAARLEASATLAGGIAHDVNNLMSGILSHVTLMEREPQEARAERLEQIARAARRATGLAHQLLSYARGGKYDVRPTDLNAVVEDVLRRQRGSLRSIAHFPDDPQVN